MTLPFQKVELKCLQLYIYKEVTQNTFMEGDSP